MLLIVIGLIQKLYITKAASLDHVLKMKCVRMTMIESACQVSHDDAGRFNVDIRFYVYFTFSIQSIFNELGC